MTYTVTVTRQGQISIPAPIRHRLNLGRFRQALIYEDANDHFIIEPIANLLSLFGQVKSRRRFKSQYVREKFKKHLAQRNRR